MLDSDLVRVDLLRLKRKLYNSYPEGSVERKTFLLASKISEIGYLSHVVPPDVVKFVFDEYHYKMKMELLDILLNFGLTISIGFLMRSLHNLYGKNIILSFWYFPLSLFFFNGLRHVWNVFSTWRSMRDFKNEYTIINDKIKKLSEEVKKIGDGK